MLFDAGRHTYAGLRMPWPVRSDRGWTLVHRGAGIAFGAAGMGLMALAWLDVGLGMQIAGFAAALLAPVGVAAAVTVIVDR